MINATENKVPVIKSSIQNASTNKSKSESKLSDFDQLLSLHLGKSSVNERPVQGKAGLNQCNKTVSDLNSEENANPENSLELDDLDTLLTSLQNILDLILKISDKQQGATQETNDDAQNNQVIISLNDSLEDESQNENLIGSFLQLLRQVDMNQLTGLNKSQNQDIANIFQDLTKFKQLSADNMIQVQNSLTDEQKELLQNLYQTLQAKMSKSEVLQTAFANVNSGMLQKTENLPLFQVKPYVFVQNLNNTTEDSKVTGNTQTTNTITLQNVEGQENGQNEQPSMQIPELQNEVANVPFFSAKGSIQLLDEGNSPVTMEKFVKDFEAILSKSKFFHNGQIQKLTIQLKPEYLGTLKIELIQQQNELVAKIISSTTSAKELLESQVQALRQAFIQQNIPVSRIDFINEMKQETNYNDQNNQNRGQSNPDQQREKEKDQNEDNFIDTLKDSLLYYEI